MKTFEFGNNENCCFSVWHYNKENAMAITVIDSNTNEEIETLTVLNTEMDYDIGFTLIYADVISGDEISGFKTGTEILQELGIIEKVYETYNFDEKYAGENVIKVDQCKIDLYKLKEYSKFWDFGEFPEENFE